jgi:hypothetical protein
MTEFKLVVIVQLNGSIRSTQDLMVKEGDSIRDLKERIATCTGITAERQRLEYQNQTLSDWNNVQTLLDLDITAATAAANTPCLMVHNIEADAGGASAAGGPDDLDNRSFRIAGQALVRANAVYQQLVVKAAPLVASAKARGGILLSQAEASLPPALQVQLRQEEFRVRVRAVIQLGGFTVAAVVAFRIVLRRLLQLFVYLFDRFPVRLGLYVCCARISQMLFNGEVTLAELLSGDTGTDGRPADGSFDGLVKRVARVAVLVINSVSPGFLAELQRH